MKTLRATRALGHRGRWPVQSLVRLLAIPMLSALPHLASAADTLSSLAGELLDADAAVRAATPVEPGLVINVGSLGNKMLLRQISVRIDDAAPLTYAYSDAESRALKDNASHPFAALSLPPGRHRLRAEFIAEEAIAPVQSARLHGRFEQMIDPGAEPLTIELVIEDKFFGTPHLKLREAAPDQSRVQIETDSAVRVAHFLMVDDRNFEAASRLEAAQARLGASPGLQRSLAESLRGLGLNARADALDSTTANTATSGAAETAPVQESLIGALAARYNEAVLQLRNGDSAASLATLDAIGTADAAGEDALGLRDRANLTLGEALLRASRGDDAREAFARVRSPGPFANRALLGYGWAFLVPPGPRSVAEKTADAPEERRRRAPLEMLKTDARERERLLRRALVPWVELTGRNPIDPAVQEGRLALAFALEQLGSHQQALESWQRTIKSFDDVRGWLDGARTQVTSHRMLAVIDAADLRNVGGWHWWFADLPPADAHWWLSNRPDEPVPESFYLEPLLSEPHFLQALADYRALRDCAAVLDADTQGLAGADAGLGSRLASLHARVDGVIAGQRGRLEELALAELERQRVQTQGYLAEVRFAIARLNDRPAERVAQAARTP